MTESDKKVILQRMGALCSRREYCISEVDDKLRQWNVEDEDDRNAIIAHLIEENFIDEARFSHAYARDKMRYNHWGRVKIDQMLRHLRVGSEARKTALEELPEEEYCDILRQVAQSKQRSVTGRNAYERRGKLVRFLLGRGFEIDLIREVIDFDGDDD